MKKHEMIALVRLLAAPVLTAVLGLVILVSPDAVSALAGKVLALLLCLAGVGFGYLAIREGGTERPGRILRAVLCFGSGLWLVANPMLLTQGVARFAGIALILRGAGELIPQFRSGQGMPPLNRKTVISVMTVLVGLVLLVLPGEVSRLVLSLCGIVLIGIGCAEGYDRLKGRRALTDGEEKPADIVDAL